MYTSIALKFCLLQGNQEGPDLNDLLQVSVCAEDFGLSEGI
jgi:hypothetical protein